MKKLSHNEIIDLFPVIKMNTREPFELLGIGYTVMDQTQKSPSFERKIILDDNIMCVVEYALYWNYDIEHLYDLEHIWLYFDYEMKLVNCEVSFHGKVINGLTEQNWVDNNKLYLYCQAGKHALAPDLNVFENWKNYRSATWETVGKDGLLITPILEERLVTNDVIDDQVKAYMQKFKFHLSETYESMDMPQVLFMPWPYLNHEIPQMIKEELAVIKYHEEIYKREVEYV